MTLKPQKAQTNKVNAASEESEHQTSQVKQEIQSEVEETPKNYARAKKSAQKQHDAQPEVASEPQGLNETHGPVWMPGREDVVPGRRKSDEFALSVSEAALLHMAHREPGYLPKVKEAAYELIYDSERWLCGHIAQPFAIPGVNLSRWWRAFEVEGLWFVLKPRDPPPFSKVREYELLPALGPTPDDEPPPTLRRLQTSPPPEYIGPPRRRRNRGDANGARPTAKPPQVKGKKRNDVKRAFTLLYNSARGELELLSQKFAFGVSVSWRKAKPRVLRGLVQIRRFDRACGTVLHDLRVVGASVVRALPTAQVFSLATHKNLTWERERAPEAFSASGSLEASDVGHAIIPRLKLNSWNWDEPPLPWADDLFGVLWPPNLFGALEEEVFT